MHSGLAFNTGPPGLLKLLRGLPRHIYLINGDHQPPCRMVPRALLLRSFSFLFSFSVLYCTLKEDTQETSDPRGKIGGATNHISLAGLSLEDTFFYMRSMDRLNRVFKSTMLMLVVVHLCFVFTKWYSIWSALLGHRIRREQAPGGIEPRRLVEMNFNSKELAAKASFSQLFTCNPLLHLMSHG